MIRLVAPLASLLFFCLSCTSAAPAAAASATPPIVSSATLTPIFDERTMHWEEDLNQIIVALEQHHPDPYWRFTKDEYEEAIEQVRARLHELSDDQITIEIIRLTAMIDGHSGIYVGNLPDWNFARIRFYLFEEGLGVVGVEDSTLVGGRLVAIGDTPAEKALEAVWTLANYDNGVTRKSFAVHFLAVPRVLAGLGIITDPSEANYTIETLNGDLATITPEIGSHREYLNWFGPYVVGHVQDQRAMYLEDRWNPFWWRHLDDDTFYAQYNQVVSLGSLTDFAQAIDARPGAKIVLDMRHNLGGNLYTYGALLNLLVERFRDSCGLHVIVGRDTFSAAMTFVIKLEQSTTATFYGERTGASPNLYGDPRTTLLPNSKLPFGVSSIYWETAGPEDDRLWLEPAIVVPVRLDDWRAGRDPVLEAVLDSELCGQR